MLENLRKLRLEMNISQSKLGAEIGVTQQAINKYENHKIEPDIHTLKLLAGFFGTTIDYLVGYCEERDPSVDAQILLSRREEELIKSFRKINKSQKESIELVLSNYLK